MNLLPIKKVLLLPVLFISINVIARSNVTPGFGYPSGMGNAFVSQYDLEAFSHNQAGLAKLINPSFSLFYENRFCLKELSLRGILIGIPSGNGVFSTCLQSFGPSKWMETTFSVAYSLKLTPKLSGGIQFSYLGMKLPEENQTLSSVGTEIGFIFQLSPTLFVGAHLANPFSIPFYTMSYNDKIPWRLSLGGHSLITNEITMAIETEKTEYQKTVFKAGIEWKVVDQFFLRGGFNTGPVRLSGGIGFCYRLIKVNIAFSYHQVLGTTPSISMNYSLK